MAISLMNKFSAEDPYSALTPEQSEYARKVAAAREAARHSTGPKTGEGKAVSSQNARKHGFAGATMVIDDEDQEAYNLHLDAYHEAFQPVGQPECDAVRLAANALWRIDRLTSLETALLDLEISHNAPHIDATLRFLTHHHYAAIAFKQQIGDGNAIDLCRRYLSSAHRDFHRAISILHLLQEKRAAQPPKPEPEPAPQGIHIVRQPQLIQQEPNEPVLKTPKMQNARKNSRKSRRQQRK